MPRSPNSDCPTVDKRQSPAGKDETCRATSPTELRHPTNRKGSFPGHTHPRFANIRSPYLAKDGGSIIDLDINYNSRSFSIATARWLTLGSPETRLGGKDEGVVGRPRKNSLNYVTGRSGLSWRATMRTALDGVPGRALVASSASTRRCSASGYARPMWTRASLAA
jgi:hypothetical protein